MISQPNNDPKSGSGLAKAGGRRRDLLSGIGLAFGLAVIASIGAGPILENSAQAKTVSKPRTHVVEIRDFKFFPATINVKAGDRVVWKNLDIAPHTATGKGWDSGKLDHNQSWTLKVSGKGVLEYICAYHPAMKAKIVVT